jgi:hypothetical protein
MAVIYVLNEALRFFSAGGRVQFFSILGSFCDKTMTSGFLGKRGLTFALKKAH